MKVTRMNRIVVALFLILGIISFGTLGYMIIEKWDFFNSIYMTIITISTVGFSEIGVLSAKGRTLTMILIVLGIGIGGYTIGNLSAFLIEVQIQNLFRGRKMEKNISTMKNHIIVCGYGRTGAEIVEVLRADSKEFLLIEKDENRILEAQEKNCLVITGNATDDEVLIKAGVERATGLITALGNDADNLYVVLTARGMNPDLKIIARGIDDTAGTKLKRAGANNVVSPFTIAGRRMASLVMKPQIVEFLEVMVNSGEFELKLEQITINKKSYLVNKKLNQSNIKSETDGATIIGIKKSDEEKMTINPMGNTLLEENDILIALGNDAQISKLIEIAERRRFLDIT